MDESEQTHHKKSKLYLILILIIVILVAGSSTGYYFYHKQQVAIAKAKAIAVKKRAKYIKLENTYDNNFGIVLRDLESVYQDIKAVADGYVEIWNDAIFDPVGAIAGPDFTVTKDFNQAIALKTEDFKADGSLDNMKNDDNILKRDMTDLGNPPNNFKDVTSKFEDTYGKCQTYYNLAETPNGSFNSYKNQTDDLKSQIESEINEIEISIPKIPKK